MSGTRERKLSIICVLRGLLLNAPHSSNPCYVLVSCKVVYYASALLTVVATMVVAITSLYSYTFMGV